LNLRYRLFLKSRQHLLYPKYLLNHSFLHFPHFLKNLKNLKNLK
jgi:hypothetical protein